MLAGEREVMLTDAVGGTPLVALTNVVPDGIGDVFVKVEWFSPTGSHKDRAALAMIEEAERRGDLRPGMTVVEYTAGSTGSALAFVCAAKGYRLKVVCSDAFSETKLRTMRALGAELTLVPSDAGRVTPDLTMRMVEKAAELAAEPDTYFTDQRRNADTITGYRSVGEELLRQLDRPIDVFCAAVGTAAMAMGVATALRAAGSASKVVVFEPASSPVISGGRPGTHHVEGIGSGTIPPLLDPDLYDEVRPIEETAARAMARRLAAEEGLLAGTSSGLNVAGAIEIATELGPGSAVVTIACDTGLKYLGGDLYEV
jgi:cysteine synthase A